MNQKQFDALIETVRRISERVSMCILATGSLSPVAIRMSENNEAKAIDSLRKLLTESELHWAYNPGARGQTNATKAMDNLTVELPPRKEETMRQSIHVKSKAILSDQRVNELVNEIHHRVTADGTQRFRYNYEDVIRKAIVEGAQAVCSHKNIFHTQDAQWCGDCGKYSEGAKL